MTIALISTSAAKKRCTNEASERLRDLVDAGHEVHIVTSRHTLYPEGVDRCLFDLIPPERFIVASRDMFERDMEEDRFGADAPHVVDVWARALAVDGVASALADAGVPMPTERVGRRGRKVRLTYHDYRAAARKAGIIIS